MSPTPDTLARGFAVGRYIVLELLGTGGMGAVYAAYDPELDRRVALKLLHTRANTDESISASRERLLREAQALAQLAHPNVVAIHDVGRTDAGVFIAMELVVGRTLRAWLHDHGTEGWRRIAPVFRAAGEGLAAAHRAGIVHRDFKPDNVIVGDDGRVRVVDFGLALSEREATTDDGVIAGTPSYMAPEQLASRATDSRTDQFTFCVALYEALYRKRPFPGRTFEEVQRSIDAGLPPEPPTTHRTPARVRRAVRRGLSVDPAGRHPSMEALLRELHADATATSRIVVASALALTLVVAAGGVMARERARTSAQCRGGDAQAAAVWNPTARDRLSAAFKASGKPFAEDARRSVTETLDAYVPRWVAMRREACEATSVRKEQSEELLDLRIACLDSALVHVREEVEIFASAAPSVVERAPAAARQLPPLDACADAVRLRGAPPLPTTPEGRERFNAASNDLARARSLSYTGDLAASATLAERVLEAARATDIPRVEAAALILRGRLRTNMGKPAEAEADLWNAALRALREHDDERAVEAWGLLVFVQGSQLAHYADADRTADLAAAAAVRLGDADALRGALLRNRAAYLVDAGKYDEAEPLLREALTRMERALGVEHPNYAATLETLGILQHARGEQSSALQTQERVLALREKLGGPNHPLVATSLFNLGLVKASLGRHGDALVDCRRGVAVASALGDAGSASANNALMCVAAQYRALDDAAAARATDEDVLRRVRAAGGADTDDEGYTLQALAADAVLARDGKSAIDYATKARATLRTALGADHPSLIDTEELLARGQLLTARLDDAVATLDHALKENERLHLGAAAPRASLERALGETLAKKRDGAGATVLLERALARLGEVKEGDPLDLADTQLVLASALALPGGDVGRARAMAASAVRAYGALGRGAERRLREAQELERELAASASR